MWLSFWHSGIDIDGLIVTLGGSWYDTERRFILKRKNDANIFY